MNQGYGLILNKNLNFDLCSPSYSTGLIAVHFSVMTSNKFLYNDGIVYPINGVTSDALDNKHSVLHLYIDDKFYKYLVGYCASHLVIQNKALSIFDCGEVSQSVDAKIKLSMNC